MALFSDLDRLFRPNSQGDIKIREDLAAVENAIINLILTEEGEREFNPNVGANLLAAVFEPNDRITQEEIELEVRTALENEPRATLLSVEAEIHQDRYAMELIIRWAAPRLNEERVETNLQIQAVQDDG